ncbi:MAG: hypothetical protein EON90_06675 [Brevundimonas sp.]|nr:MAG: hypothetical protein EON90_06675 [Brevundimonas sp.]
MAAKLKVFRYADGFHSWTVAASSRAKALAAWGVKRDLFKDGAAEEVDSGADHDAALESPGELIERGLAVDIGRVAKASAPKQKTSAAGEKAKARVKALEAELDQLDQAQAAETEALEARRVDLEAEARTIETRQSKDRNALKDRLRAVRTKLD